MSIKLPTGKGETVVFWTEGEESGGGEPSRGVLTSDGDGAWTMSFELGMAGYEDEKADDDGMIWESGCGAFLPADVGMSGFLGDLTRTFRDCDRDVAGAIDMLARGKSEFPLRKPITLVHMTGSRRFKVVLKSVGGDTNGRPIMTIEQTRPLIAEEWIVVLKRLAKASDWWTDQMGDMA